MTGSTCWTDNIVVPQTLHLGMVRSPLGRAAVRGVDLARVRGRRDVLDAFTGPDLRELWQVPFPTNGPPGARSVDHFPLVLEEARHIGDGIACLLAESRSAAADAVAETVLDLEPLPAVIGVEAGLSSEHHVHSALGTNVAFDVVDDPRGDVEAAFAEADVVLERRYVNDRVVVSSLEPRATLAIPDSHGNLTIYTSTQVPHRIRDHIALILGMEISRVRVIAPDVGGAFGAKLDCYPEDVLCAALALRTGRPVRYTATRTEDFVATFQGRGQVQHVAVSARADGTLLGMRAHVLADLGAYPSRNGMNISMNARTTLPGCYRWQAYSFRCTGVLTNAAPTGPYRGAGRPEATFAVERAMDDLAHALGKDPADLRRRNFPEPEDFPFTNIAGLEYDSGRYGEVLDRGLAAISYDEVRRRQQLNTDGSRIGIGVSSYVDRCGTGPGMREWGAVEVDEHGAVHVRTGLSPHGQGTVTSLSQLVADALGVQPQDISVQHGDTRAVPTGTGTFGSRSMPVGAAAVYVAAEVVAEKAREVAAHLLEAAPGDIEVVAGGFQVRGSPGTGVTLAAVAEAAHGGDAPEGMSPKLEASGSFEPEGFTMPFGTHIAVVEVDVDTGKVTVERYVAVDDVGHVVNPLLLEGQLHGGIAQGIAQALYEEVSYDAAGSLLTSSFVDYNLPTAADVPVYELLRTVTPAAANPLGVKGAGEAGSIAAPPAIVNAVVDALRPLGVLDVEMPCTPARVWKAINDAGTG